MDIFLFYAFAPIFTHTSEENMVAQVPMHQHTTGLVIRPSLIPLQILYSSVPPICREREMVPSCTFDKTSSKIYKEALLGVFLLFHRIMAEVSEQILLVFLLFILNREDYACLWNTFNFF